MQIFAMEQSRDRKSQAVRNQRPDKSAGLWCRRPACLCGRQAGRRDAWTTKWQHAAILHFWRAVEKNA